MKSVLRELPPPLGSSFIVKEEIASRFSAPFHYHEGYEFTFIVKGQGKFYGGDQVLNFSDGDVYFFGPLFPHYFVNEQPSEEPHVHSVVIQFQSDFLGRDVLEKPEFYRVRELLESDGLGIKLKAPDEWIRKAFIEMSREEGIRKIMYLIELLDKISGLDPEDVEMLSSQPPPTRKNFSKLDSVYRYALENFRGDVNSREAASLACLNEAAFCRYFKRQTKKTFSQFVNQVRIIHATSLLRDGNASIMEVCFESGFNNLSYFNRQFRKLMNRTPMEYRKTIKP
jgi:AraC-like DNA-binding protein